MTTIYLFERNDLLREGLKSYLAGTKFQVSAEFGGMSEFNDTPPISPPDLIITGVNRHACDLPLLEFKEHINRLRDYFPEARLVILASTEEIRLMPDILYCNADGYILRDISRDAILNYLNLAMIGEKALPGPVAMLFATLQTELDPEALARLPINAYSLSDRENDIVKCLVLGESNKLIARRLEITESTVKGHLKIILRKLGVQNRTQAALLAFRHSDETIPSNGAMAA